MKARPQQRPFTEILLQVIGPALIMLMVGSLVFFLINLFYRGPHYGRLCWVFGLFTAASVLVSRISIQEGQSRGALFGFALAVATMITSMQLVEFKGPLSLMAPLFLFGFIALVMWSASRLTWDTTVIDQSRDATAMGLAERVRRQWRSHSVRETPDEATAEATATVPDDDGPVRRSDARAGNLLFALLTGAGTQNTPGLWVFYFSMAALPIFGLGQWFFSSDEQGGAAWAGLLFAVYMGAAAALLGTTSLLGLQRYLNERRLELPEEVARRWMTLTAATALGLLLLLAVIPKPDVQSSFEQSLAAFSSRQRPSSEWAWGRDGQQPGSRPQSTESGEQGSVSSSGQGESGSGGEGKPNQGGGSDRQSTSSSSQSPAQTPSRSTSSNPDRQSKSPSSRSPAEKPTSSGQKGDSGQSSTEQSSGAGQPPSGTQSPASESKNSNSHRSGQQDSESGAGEGSGEGSKPRTSDPSSAGEASSPPSGNPSELRRRAEEQQARRQDQTADQRDNASQRPPQNSDGGQSDASTSNAATPPKTESQPNRPRDAANPSESTATASNSSPPTSPMTFPASQIASLLTYLLAALALAGIVVLFRQELRQLWSDLLAWWNGMQRPRERTGPNASPFATATSSERKRTFSEFRNPLESRGARDWRPQELISYSFSALEALANDSKVERAPDETPYEFAKRVGRQMQALAAAAPGFVEAYGRIVYGGEETSLAPRDRQTLQTLWAAMQRSHEQLL